MNGDKHLFRVQKTLNRRSFLKKASAGAVVLAAGFHGQAYANFGEIESAFPNRLRIPELLEGNSYDLTLQNGVTRFRDGIDTVTRGINGSYLGPTLRFRNGEKVRFNITNSIGEPATLHWHGIHLPASQDGGPHQVISDGDTWKPEYTVKQKAGTFWYHSHQINKTAEHVWQGIAGMIFLDDDESNALPLPRSYGIDDIPLVVQDRRFTSDGQMPYRTSMHDRMMGMVGDTPLVNGTLTPFFEAKTGLVRLRILNASNGSLYNFGFDDDRSFHQIASDGGLLEEPVEMTRLLLSPAERAEIIVDVSDGNTIVLNSVPEAGGTGRRNRMGMMMENTVAQRFDFLEIRSEGASAGTQSVPSKLTTINLLNPEDAAVTRRFSMEVIMGPAMMSAQGRTHTINSKPMDMDRIDARVNVGDIEIWEIENTSMMAHPFHIHDVQFQILDRDGDRPKLGERGLKDTVLVFPGELVRFIAKFEDYADPENPYMFHCHILEHEDMGMMGQFVVV